NLSRVACVAFAADGNTLAASEDVPGGLKPCAIELWDLTSRKRKDTFKGHLGSVRRVQFTPDGTGLVATGGSYGKMGEIKVWDLATRQTRVSQLLPQGFYSDAAFSPDGKQLALGVNFQDGKGDLQVWDFATLPGHMVLEG